MIPAAIAGLGVQKDFIEPKRHDGCLFTGQVMHEVQHAALGFEPHNILVTDGKRIQTQVLIKSPAQRLTFFMAVSKLFHKPI
jgi:hypothetical protein